MIVLGVALAVIVQYITPIDQILALPGGHTNTNINNDKDKVVKQDKEKDKCKDKPKKNVPPTCYTILG